MLDLCILPPVEFESQLTAKFLSLDGIDDFTLYSFVASLKVSCLFGDMLFMVELE